MGRNPHLQFMIKRPYCLNAAREEAILLGKSTYFTGKPCKHGHIAERRVSTKTCIQCAKEIHHAKDRDNYRNPDNTFHRQFLQRKQFAVKMEYRFLLHLKNYTNLNFVQCLA